jgi:hypothetical protein
MNLTKWLEGLLPRIGKATVLEDLRITEKEFLDTVTPCYAQAAEYFKVAKFKSPDVIALSSIFYRNYSKPASSGKVNFISEISDQIPTILKNLNHLEIQIEDLFSRDIIREGLSVRKAILLLHAENMSTVSRFSIDLLDYVYHKEIEMQTNLADNDILPVTEKKMTSGIGHFARCFSLLAIKPEKFIKEIGTIPDVVVNLKNEAAVFSANSANLIHANDALLLGGETLNPIYHIRLIIAEWQATRYKAYGAKKKLLELRLLNLKTTSSGEPNLAVQKEIEYMEERIRTLDYQMKKMES